MQSALNGLVFRLLQLHHLAELVGLAGLALANDLGRWLKQIEQLASLRLFAPGH